ncbi:MAG: branched-chain amino acid ABC transporter permease, partial [Candidatus Competibacterales bacterium]
MALVLAQFLTGLASASALFLVAAGLSLVFGVTRVVNFAHGSFYLLGAYLGYTLINALGGGAWGFWLAGALTALVVGLVGVVMEVVVLRPIYRSPELFPLLATFGVVLVIQDTALWIWGPQDLLGPRAPGFTGTVTLLGQPIPQYDLLLIILAPLVLLALWLALHRTRWGILLRATTQDREMVAALGVNGRLLMTSALFVGAALAGLGGAIQLPKGDANLGMDLNIIVEAFVVTVVGGMGSLGGAYLAALLISSIKVFAVANAQYSVLGIAVWQLELVLVFIVMAVVLVLRPQGLLGRAAVLQEIQGGHAHPPLAPGGGGLWVTLALGVGAALAALGVGKYGVGLAAEVLLWALFAGGRRLL